MYHCILDSVPFMPSPFIELEVGERVVKLTNPDKVLFPKAEKTKRDLAEYYVAVGEGIVRAHRRGARRPGAGLAFAFTAGRLSE